MTFTLMSKVTPDSSTIPLSTHVHRTSKDLSSNTMDKEPKSEFPMYSISGKEELKPRSSYYLYRALCFPYDGDAILSRRTGYI